MKYIFLDIDGVLNSGFNDKMLDFLNLSDDSTFDKKCLITFSYLMKNLPDTKIVLSSSWGYSLSNPKLLKRLEDAFKTYDIPIWIDTIAKDFNIVSIDDNFYAHRGKAIDRYVKRKHIKYSDIVILDDEDLILSNSLKNIFIHINTHDGITHSDCIKIWNKFSLPIYIFRK